MNQYLLIDVNSIFHRSYSSLIKKIPLNKDIYGNPCVGTYGFFNTLFKTIRVLGGAAKIKGYLFAYDCKGSTRIRKDLDPLYKSNRKPKDSHFYSDFNILIEKYIPMLNVLPLGKSDYEADDIIASSCKYLSNLDEENKIFILSPDSDLEQCAKYINSTCDIGWIKTQPKWDVLSVNEILYKWGVNDPNDISIIKAIAGDSSDCIKGIRGYNKQNSLGVYMNKEFINNYKEIIDLNLSLILFKDDFLAVPEKINISRERLNNIFSDMGSDTLLKRIDKICEPSDR